MKKIIALMLLSAVAMPLLAANGASFDLAGAMEKFWNEMGLMSFFLGDG